MGFGWVGMVQGSWEVLWGSGIRHPGSGVNVPPIEIILLFYFFIFFKKKITGTLEHLG